jgi:hypothetical protein
MAASMTSMLAWRMRHQEMTITFGVWENCVFRAGLVPAGEVEVTQLTDPAKAHQRAQELTTALEGLGGTIEGAPVVIDVGEFMESELRVSRSKGGATVRHMPHAARVLTARAWPPHGYNWKTV